MEIRKQLIKRTDRVFDGKNPVEFITIHETGNFVRGAGAAAHANAQSNGNQRQASWHYQVDDTEVVQSFNDNQQCWHAGDGRGPGNLTSIGIEICVNPDSDFTKALDNAASLVAIKMLQYSVPLANVVQHNFWSGKNCPMRLRSGSAELDWAGFLQLVRDKITPKKATPAPTISRMVSPLAGYLTQPFRTGRHLGIDIGNGGVERAPVYAAFAGTISKVHSGAKHGDRASTWAPGRTSNAVLVKNVGAGSSGDGETQAYGHVTLASGLKVGSVVKAGQLIGHLDNSGNWTGWHLHLEMWDRRGSAYDPRLAYDRWGIQIGSKPSQVTEPIPKPSVPTPKPPVVGSASHLAWQKRQNKYGKAGLYEDGVNGPISKKWKDWVANQLQRYLPAWRDVPKLVRDGDYAAVTASAAKVMQANNGLVPDGVVDTVSVNYMRKHGSPITHRPRTR